MADTNLGNFLTSLEYTGISRPNRFRVIIHCENLLTLPYFQQLSLSGLDMTRRLKFMCEAAELPGSSFATSDVRTYGPTIQHPYDTLYPEIPLTFILGENMTEKKFFDAWNYSIQDPATQDLNYSDTYTTNVEIHQLDEYGNVRYQVTLIHAYPLAVNQSILSYGEKDTYGRLTVRMTYEKWINNDADITYQNEPTLKNDLGKSKGIFVPFNSTIQRT
jgi:hypothetical protein